MPAPTPALRGKDEIVVANVVQRWLGGRRSSQVLFLIVV